MEYMYGDREGRLWWKDAKAVLPIVHGGKVLMTRVGHDQRSFRIQTPCVQLWKRVRFIDVMKGEKYMPW